MLLRVHSDKPEELNEALADIDKEIRSTLNKALDDISKKLRDNAKGKEAIEKVKLEYFFQVEREGNDFKFNVKYYMENPLSNKFLKGQLMEEIKKADSTAREI